MYIDPYIFVVLNERNYVGIPVRIYIHIYTYVVMYGFLYLKLSVYVCLS